MCYSINLLWQVARVLNGAYHTKQTKKGISILYPCLFWAGEVCVGATAVYWCMTGMHACMHAYAFVSFDVGFAEAQAPRKQAGQGAACTTPLTARSAACCNCKLASPTRTCRGGDQGAWDQGGTCHRYGDGSAPMAHSNHISAVLGALPRQRSLSPHQRKIHSRATA